MAIAAVLWLGSRWLGSPASEAGSGGGRRAGGPDVVLRSEGYVVKTEPIRETVRTVGTLNANESVDIVSELSRRLVSIRVAEGTVAEKDQVLFKLDDADLRAELIKLQVRRGLAAKTEERQRDLVAKQALSQQAYDQAIAELRMIDAELSSLRVTLAKTEIRAPFKARVGLRRVSEGAWVTPTTLLTTLQDTTRVKIDFTLPERNAGAVSLGQRFQFRVSGRGESFEGEVIAIESSIDADSRSLRVRGMSENSAGALVPGAFASLEIPVQQNAAGIVVPSTALIPTATGHAVFLLREGKAELRELEVGVRTASSVEILRGLQPGDTVLTTNLLRLRPGSRVELEKAAAPNAS